MTFKYFAFITTSKPAYQYLVREFPRSIAFRFSYFYVRIGKLP